MKRIRRLLPILTAVLLILPGMTVHAEKNAVEKQSVKTLEGIVTMTLENVLSLEGTIKASAEDKAAAASIQSATISCKGDALCMDSDNKIFVASNGEPVTITIEAKMKFSKAGIYTLELDGGITDQDGKYEDYSESKDFIKKIEITAGDPEASDSTNNQDTDKDKDTKIEIDFEVETEELEKTLGEVAEAIKSDEQLAMMQQLLAKMDQGLALLEGGNQEQVDETTEELKESLENLELTAETTENGEKEGKETVTESEEEVIETNDDSVLNNIFKYLKWVLPILTLAIFIAALIYFWRKAKNNTPDYDGAPMVDYDIEDDDE